jgi:hypothetical protein
MACASLFAGGCSNAPPAPDSGNPAHCIAGYNWMWNLLHKRGDASAALRLQATARELYLADKLRRSGQADGGQAEATSITLKYGSDGNIMGALAQSCEEALKSDRGFRDNEEALMSRARLVDPDCAAGGSCPPG